MSLALQPVSFFVIFFVTQLLFVFQVGAQVRAEVPVCINREANPRNLVFVNDLKNARPGTFIDQWKQERSTTACTNCSPTPEPVVSSGVENIKEVAGEIETQARSQTRAPPRSSSPVIRRGFMGRYYYRDADGKKINLTKEEAEEMQAARIQGRSKAISDQLTQDIEETTQNIINQRMSEKVSQKLRVSNNIPLTLPSMSPTSVRPVCVARTLNKLRPSGTKRHCTSDQGGGTVMNSIPCITNDIADYMTWSMNKAFECLNDPNDPLDAELFYKKINRESNFNFWLENKNTGRGLGQLTFVAMQEMMGSSYNSNAKAQFKHDGRNMLERILKENPKCKMYHGIANPNLSASESMYPRPYNPNKCAVLSLDEGIQRNFLASIALYKYYRDEKPVYSSAKVLEDLNIPKTNPDFTRMKNLLALMSYSSIGPQSARNIAMSRSGQMRANMTYTQFESVIKAHPRAKYLRDIDRSFNAIQSPGENLVCAE